jgi:hypothetical protein
MVTLGRPKWTERYIDQHCASPIAKLVPLKSALAVGATVRVSRDRPSLYPSYLHSRSRDFRPGFWEPKFRGGLLAL